MITSKSMNIDWPHNIVTRKIPEEVVKFYGVCANIKKKCYVRVQSHREQNPPPSPPPPPLPLTTLSFFPGQSKDKKLLNQLPGRPFYASKSSIMYWLPWRSHFLYTRAFYIFKGRAHGSAQVHESKYFFTFACYDPRLFNLIRCL